MYVFTSKGIQVIDLDSIFQMHQDIQPIKSMYFTLDCNGECAHYDMIKIHNKNVTLEYKNIDKHKRGLVHTLWLREEHLESWLIWN